MPACKITKWWCNEMLLLKWFVKVLVEIVAVAKRCETMQAVEGGNEKGDILAPNATKKKCKSDWIYWTDTVLCDFQFEQFLLSIFDLQHFCSTYLWFFLLMFHGYKRCIRFVCVHDFNSFFSWNQSNIHIDHSEYITHFILKWNNWLNVTIIRFIALHLIGKSWCI